MTNAQKNKLIENFMGWELKWITWYDLNQWCFVNKNTGKTISGLKSDSELPYITDWNWLIEALKKFDCLYDKLSFQQESLNPKYYKQYAIKCDNIDYAITLYNINDAVNALCEGIEWYNTTLN